MESAPTSTLGMLFMTEDRMAAANPVPMVATNGPWPESQSEALRQIVGQAGVLQAVNDEVHTEAEQDDLPGGPRKNLADGNDAAAVGQRQQGPVRRRK